LSEAVVDAADVAGLSLFAGWRAQRRPSDAAARAFHLLHLLREMRGSAHVVACVAAGVSGRDAILASDGAAQAERFGWQAPFPVVDDELHARREHAEQLTDEITERKYRAALTSNEVGELVDLVGRLSDHLAQRP
jgi:hypothetical protein